jgi:ubiquinone/menaquinone biosynthesis C-methylase UbiE
MRHDCAPVILKMNDPSFEPLVKQETPGRRSSLSAVSRLRATQVGFKLSAASSEVPSGDLNVRIAKAMQVYLGETLGWKERDVAELTGRELARSIPAATLNYLASQGIRIEGTRTLDLGAGLGGLSAEVALRGGRPFAVEPATGWRKLALERIRETGDGVVVAAAGEQLPFVDGCFDVVISLQVLEHVQNPEAVMKEVFRVLKPGGFFFLACENYLAPREPHYRLAWLPLLPKALGVAYLRLRGRCPEFYRTSITYTTLPWVARMIKTTGFLSMRERRIKSLLCSPVQIETHWKRTMVGAVRRLMPVGLLTRIALLWDLTQRLFTGVIYELLQKPDPTSTRS